MVYFGRQPEFSFVFGSSDSASDSKLRWEDNKVANFYDAHSENFDQKSIGIFFDSLNSTIDSLSLFRYQSKSTDPNPNYGYATYKIDALSIPFLEIRGDSIIYSLSGMALKKQLKKVSLTARILQRHGDDTFETYDSTEWHNPDSIPKLVITFYK